MAKTHSRFFGGFVALLLVCGSVPALAGNLDSASEEALRKTLQLMGNPSERQADIDKDPNAKFADQQAKSLAGSPENAEEMYSIAAEIFQDLTMNSAGDASAMIMAMEEAKKSPKAFFAKLSPKTQARIAALAKKIEAKQKVGAGPEVAPNQKQK